MKSTPVSATARTVSSVIPPDASSSRPAARRAHRLAQLVRGHVVEQHPRHAGGQGLLQLVERRALHLDAHARRRRGQRAPRGLAHSAGERGVVLLDQDRVVAGRCGGSSPPPARTASFSSARSPGVVLRVSRMRTPVPSTASHVAGGERGDAREAAEEVERHALAGEDRRAALPATSASRPPLAPLALARRARASAVPGPRARTPSPPRAARPAPPPPSARCAPARSRRRARRRPW